MRLSLAAYGVFTLLLAAPSLGAQSSMPEAFAPRHLRYDARIHFGADSLSGAMTVELENWTTKAASRVSFLLHRLMTASRVTDDAGGAVPFAQRVVRFEDDPIRQVTQLIITLPSAVRSRQRTRLTIAYSGYITPYTEVGWLYVLDHIDTAFTILRMDALAFPVIGGRNHAANRRGPTANFTYDACIRVPAGFVVATGGALTRTKAGDGGMEWCYVSRGASPFMNIAVAKFDTIVSDGLRINYFPADSAGAKYLLGAARRAMETLTSWFGPLHTPAHLAVTEIPDGWGSQGNVVGGIIQTASAFCDTGQVNELYHELSHLWNVTDAEQPSPRWNEGLASFLEQLMKEQLNGFRGRREVEAHVIAALNARMANDSTPRTVPLIDYGRREVTDLSYSVGGLMFATLYELVGEEQFNQIIGGYYQQHRGSGSTRDLVAYARQVSRQDLSAFFDDWIFTTRWTRVVASARAPRDLATHYR